MQISDNGKRLLAQWEADKLHEYNDGAGYMTIGVGHCLTQQEISSGQLIINGEPIDYKDGITQQQSLDLLGQDLEHYEAAVNQVQAPLNQNQYDACVALAFNIGAKAFLESGVFRALNAGDFDTAIAHWRQWNKAGGHIMQGLINRRDHEITLFKTSVDNEQS